MNDAGKVCMMPKGQWSASATYEFLDVVKYAQDSWVAKQSSTNQAPAANSQYWQLLAKGVEEHFGTSTTAGATAAKVVTTTDGDFELSTGARVTVKFTNTDTAGSCTLAVDGQTAKAIYYNGAAIEAGILTAGNAFEFVYDGTNFVMVGSAGGAKAFEVSQAEYDALPAAQKNDPNKMFFITDNDDVEVPFSATSTSYDNTESGLEATNVQGAIDEISGKVYQYEEQTFTNAAELFAFIGNLSEDKQRFLFVKSLSLGAGTKQSVDIKSAITKTEIALSATTFGELLRLEDISTTRVWFTGNYTEANATSQYTLHVTTSNFDFHQITTTVQLGSDPGVTHDVNTYPISSVTLRVPVAVADD